DQISGEYLSVFSLNYQKEENNNFKINRNYEYMTAIRTSGCLTTETKKIGKKYFEGEDIIFPSILFFQVDNGLVTDSLLLKLKEKNIEEGFNEIKGYIEAAVGSLIKVEDDNKTNYKEMFDLIAGGIRAKNSRNEVKRVIKEAGPI